MNTSKHDALNEVDSHDTVSDPVSELIEQVTEEFTQRCRRGDVPTIAEYLDRYPSVAGHLKSLLPSVLMLEKSKQNRPLGGSALKKSLDTLNDFRIIREVGQGGMGIVYEAEQVSLERRVALKVLPLRSRFDAKRFTRFEREAQAAARLHHSNIVPVLNFGEHDGLYYYVMQFIDGSGLDQLIINWKEEFAQGSTPDRAHFEQVARIGMDVAGALQHAHDQGILHRDIKPANILLDHHGTVWVTDFGLAKQMDNDDLTRTGDIVGTLQYMAPEQFQSQSDPRSDVYSLGLTLYELLTLQAGFQDTNPSQLIKRKSETQPPNPRQLNPLIPRDLETVILKAISCEPSNRYPTAQAFASDLRRFLEDRPVLARRSTPVEQLWRWSRRNRVIASLSLVAMSSLLLASAVGWAGYVRTGKALERESQLRQDAELATQRADANVALSLAAIEELLQKISNRRQPEGPRREGADGRFGPPDEHFGGDPFGFPGGPPPRGPGRLGGPGRGGAPGGPGGRGRPENFEPRNEFDPPPRSENPGNRPLHVAQDEAELLKSILAFYEKFAARNATSSPHVQSGAARAYHQVGHLQSILGQSKLAAPAYRRAIELFEAQAVHASLDRRSQHDLIDSYINARPAEETQPVLAAREQEMRRALDQARKLAEESGHIVEHVELIARAHRELGFVLLGLNQTADAETHLTQAISLIDSLLERHPDGPLTRLERISASQAYADFLIRQQRRPEALETLQNCVTDLHEIAESGRNGPPVPPDLSDYFTSVAQRFREVGETEQANTLENEARNFRDRRPPPRE